MNCMHCMVSRRGVHVVSSGSGTVVGMTRRSAQETTAGEGRYDTALQVRVRARTRARLDEAVLKLSYERGERCSLASITDEALDSWLSQQGL